MPINIVSVSIEIWWASGICYSVQVLLQLFWGLGKFRLSFRPCRRCLLLLPLYAHPSSSTSRPSLRVPFLSGLVEDLLEGLDSIQGICQSHGQQFAHHSAGIGDSFFWRTPICWHRRILQGICHEIEVLTPVDQHGSTSLTLL